MKKSSKNKEETAESGEGNMACELQVPTVSDVVWRYTWRIRRYARMIAKRDTIDGPVFECSVNGITTKWVMGIRFWRGPRGKRVTNPVAVCLSLVSCWVLGDGVSASSGEQAHVLYQLGVLDASIAHWELCPFGRVAVHLANSSSMLSVGYQDISIEDRHLDKDGNVTLMVKLQLIPTEVERHTLSQDMARLLACDEDADTVVQSASEVTFKAHSNIIKNRSPVLAAMLKENDQSDIKYKLDLSELGTEVVNELFRYIYTDKVDNLETFAPRLLSPAHRFYLDGLTELCERSLVETLTPSSVGNVLLLADQCNCEPLKRAALAYCEENVTTAPNSPIGKSLAWRVMELVNPELFLEATELGSSHSSTLSSQGSRSDDQL